MNDTRTSNEQVTPVDGLIAESRAVLATHLNGTWKDDYAALRLAQMVRALLARIEETTALQRELQRARDTIDTFEMEANPRPAHEPGAAPSGNELSDVRDLEIEVRELRAELADRAAQPPRGDLELLEVARPCVRNELNRCEQLILTIEKSKPTPSHLNPAKYLEALNVESARLRSTLDRIDVRLGLTKEGSL